MVRNVCKEIALKLLTTWILYLADRWLIPETRKAYVQKSLMRETSKIYQWRVQRVFPKCTILSYEDNVENSYEII